MKHSLLYNFRFYTLPKRDYKKSFDQIFSDNKFVLIYANLIFFVSGLVYLFFEIFTRDSDIIAVTIGMVTAIILLIISTVKYRQSKNGKEINPLTIYSLVISTFFYVGLFAIYEGTLEHPNNLAVIFIIYLMCISLVFVIPPLLNLSLYLILITVFSIATISVKTPELWALDMRHVLIAGLAGGAFAWYVKRLRILSLYYADKLEKERRYFANQSATDELTQLKNRRDYLQTFERMLTTNRYDDGMLCVALLDIDYFKPLNDFYGHAYGDQCLRSMGKLFNELQKSMSIYVARVGGEEFAFLWFEKEEVNIKKVANKIIDLVHDLKIPHVKSKVVPYLTASIGVYATQIDPSRDIDTLYLLADDELYKAKKNGRNRAVVSF
jgi:diguanylate cyclase (GGDEF)-like protein